MPSTDLPGYGVDQQLLRAAGTGRTSTGVRIGAFLP